MQKLKHLLNYPLSWTRFLAAYLAIFSVIIVSIPIITDQIAEYKYRRKLHTQALEYINQAPKPTYSPIILPTRVPSTSPTPIPLNYTTDPISSLKNKIIFQDTHNIYAYDLEGNTTHAILTSKDYVTFIDTDNTRTNFYYTQIQETSLNFYKQNLLGQKQLLYSHPNHNPKYDSSFKKASLSPDNTKIVYSHNNAIYLLDLQTLQSTNLISPKINCSEVDTNVVENALKCLTYISPQWLNSEYIKFHEGKYEGGTTHLYKFQPSNNFSSVGKLTGFNPQLSPNQSRILTTNGDGYYLPGIFISDNLSTSLTQTNIFPQESPDVLSALWISNTHIAYSISPNYQFSESNNSETHIPLIALYNLDNQTISPLLDIHTKDHYTLHMWLPTFNSILFSDNLLGDTDTYSTLNIETLVISPITQIPIEIQYITTIL